MKISNKILKYWNSLSEAEKFEVRRLVFQQMSKLGIEAKKKKWGAEGFHQHMVIMNRKSQFKRFGKIKK